MGAVGDLVDDDGDGRRCIWVPWAMCVGRDDDDDDGNVGAMGDPAWGLDRETGTG